MGLLCKRLKKMGIDQTETTMGKWYEYHGLHRPDAQNEVRRQKWRVSGGDRQIGERGQEIAMFHTSDTSPISTFNRYHTYFQGNPRTSGLNYTKSLQRRVCEKKIDLTASVVCSSIIFTSFVYNLQQYLWTYSYSIGSALRRPRTNLSQYGRWGTRWSADRWSPV